MPIYWHVDMTTVLQHSPGENAAIFLQTLDKNGNRYNPARPPIITRVLLPNFTLACGYPIWMNYFDTGLYFSHFQLPKGAASVGDYLIDVVYDGAHPYWYFDGYCDGYCDGYHDGYCIGNGDGYHAEHHDGYCDGYDDGYCDGYDDGYCDGYDDGYCDGYDDGYRCRYRYAYPQKHEIFQIVVSAPYGVYSGGSGS